MSELSELILKYGSDKNASGYTPYYTKLFKNLRHKEIDLLEIGIGTLQYTPSNMHGWKSRIPHYMPGASLRAWRDYFPKARIYGADVNQDCMIEENRIQTFICDSTSESLDMSFDIIIDDGLHTFEAQSKTFSNFYPLLRRGGFYFIEDIREMDRFFSKDSVIYEQRNKVFCTEARNMLWLQKT